MIKKRRDITPTSQRSRRNLTPKIEDYKGLRENPHIWTLLYKKVFLSALRNF
jgi:hypothetical protein